MRDDQQNIRVEIVEGESILADECLVVGSVIIDSLPKGLPRGSPVQVAFKYDRSGRLHVHALHVVTGSWAEAFIKRRSGIDPDKIRSNQDILDRLTIN
jgi:molecular chaperone DnaK